MSTLIDVECEVCHKHLQRPTAQVKATKHQFCDRDCYHEWRKGRRLKKHKLLVCNFCGREFEKAPGHAKVANHYCSQECYARQATKKIALPCVECGKQIERNPSKITERNFCSRACHHSWRRKNEGGSTHPLYKSKVVPCTQCGAHLKRSPKRIETNKYHFCNSACYGKWVSVNKTGENAFHWTGGKIEVACAHCDKPLKRIRYDVETTERFFCNKKCLAAWMSTNIVGEAHPMWKGGYDYYYGPNWIEQRAKARNRDGHKCQICGATKKKFKKELHVHHIKPFREFKYIPGENDNYLLANDLKNLITLCMHCHRKAESGVIPFRLPLF